jgi:Holliday junction resolvasome RuvABC DNA-binding subunit
VDSRDWALHLLQGFEGIGPDLAAAIFDHFEGVPFRWNVEGAKGLMEVPGIGKGRAEKLWGALNAD